MMLGLLNSLFGLCSHSNTSWPLTRRKEEGPYVVCLECGKEFKYDWENMRLAKESKSKVGQLFALQGEE